ncbi:hypothetical protein CHS0354_034951 [Potamilus streckersoni]|uniref:Uncharacterized protein n=1 Tax=Potamilus streckersoni TaxID=2493646 RepID=A0AAE0VTV8_9BIVA|nr:hypothetical protein CHS0354_034951 [Potamilus streckersoni]
MEINVPEVEHCPIGTLRLVQKQDSNRTGNEPVQLSGSQSTHYHNTQFSSSKEKTQSDTGNETGPQHKRSINSFR